MKTAAPRLWFLHPRLWLVLATGLLAADEQARGDAMGAAPNDLAPEHPKLRPAHIGPFVEQVVQEQATQVALGRSERRTP